MTCDFMSALFLIFGTIAILLAFHYIFYSEKDTDVINDITCDESEETDEEFLPDIINVPGHEFLYYRLSTGDVYVLSIEDDGEHFEPFIFRDYLCKYLEGRIVEVDGDEVIAIVHTATLPD